MNMKVKHLILTALFAALTAVGAFIKIPFGPVPLTLQFLFTALAGILLGAKLGALSQLVYIAMGLIGLPIFAGGIGGFNAISSPSFGYLIGFIMGAYTIGKVVELSKKTNFVTLLLASLMGAVVIYIFGVPYLYLIIKFLVGKNISMIAAIKTGMLIFIPGDLVKCLVAAAIGTKVVPAIRSIVKD